MGAVQQIATVKNVHGTSKVHLYRNSSVETVLQNSFSIQAQGSGSYSPGQSKP